MPDGEVHFALGSIARSCNNIHYFALMHMRTPSLGELSSSNPPGLFESSRFEIRHFLGEGGFGVVYEAFDRELDTTVAVKVLRQGSARGVQQFKREFRSLADLRHPNLVSLGELHCENGIWFFTMELVRGMTFLEWVWSAEEQRSSGDTRRVRIDRARLISSIDQLAAGLETMHRAGRLYRDIKPSNVMVTPAGRLVILDFGLVAMLEEGDTGIWGGTPGYRAPEASPLGPGMDWFSVGAMLHEVVRGSPPGFAGGDRSPVVTNVGEVDDIARLSDELTDRDPRKRRLDRPLLQAHVDAPMPTRAQVRAPIIGRGQQLAALHAAFEIANAGAPQVAIVHGGSGIGKTRLMRQFLEDVRAVGLTLHASCHERELIPFRALDSVVEGLVRQLASFEPGVRDLQVPVHAHALARLFPSFLALPAFAASVAASRELPDLQTLRRQAFAAFHELLAKLSERSTIVISIDDLQWGDSDSADLLLDIIKSRAPLRLLLLVCCRSDGALPGLLPSWWRELFDQVSPHDVPVSPLVSSDVEALASSLLGHAPQAPVVARIVAQSGGSPFFIQQLVQHATVRDGVIGAVPDLADLLARQLSDLSGTARALAVRLALVGRPVEGKTALVLAPELESARGALAELQRARITMVHDEGSGVVVELAHDQLRIAVVATVPREDWAAQNRRVGEILEMIPRYAHEPDLVFSLFYEAGVRTKASEYAERAADRAASSFAFHQAAELYRKSSDCADDDLRRRALRRRLADTLADGGGGAAAGPIYDELARTMPVGDAVALRRRAMESYLISGHVDEGLATLRALCGELDLSFPPTPRRAFVASLGLMLAARVRGVAIAANANPTSPAEAVRIDTCFSAAKGLIGSDAMRGSYFAFLALDLAVRARDTERTTRYLAFVGAAILAAAGGSLERWGKRMLAAAEREIRSRNDPALLGTLLVCKGQTAILDGLWPDALRYSDEALEVLRERCRNVTWERNFCQMGALRALEELGDQKESMLRVERFLREAEQDGDVYARVTGGIWNALNRLAIGDVGAARSCADAAAQAWSPDGYHVQHLYSMRVHLHADLYEGNPRAAMDRLDRDWEAIKASFLLRVPTGRIDVLLMRGRTALALADHELSTRRDGLKIVDRTIKSLRKETRPDAAAHADLLHGGATAIRGDRERAALLFAKAQGRFTSLSMQLFSACAAYRRGEMEGLEHGRARRDAAVAVLTAQQIKNPSSWLALCTARPARLELL